MKRDTTGKFIRNWDSETKQRVSVTLTATAWQQLDQEAQRRGISRSEVIEQVARSFNSNHQHPRQNGISNKPVEEETPCAALALEAERKVATVLESISDAFVAFDRDWRYTYVNRAAAQLLQKTPEELIGKHVWSEVYPSAVNTLAYQQLHRAMVEQVPVAWEEWGEPIQRWLEVNAYPAAEGVAAYFRDITNRKQNEAALAERTARLQEQAQLLDLAIDAILVHDLDNHITYWNHGAQEMYGWSQEQALGNCANSLLRTQFPQALEEIEAEFFKVGRWEGELVQQRQDGTTVTVLSRWALQRDQSGQPVAILEINHDITERKQAAEERERLLQALELERARLEAVLQQMPAGVFIADAISDELVLINEQAKQITGYRFEPSLQPEAYDSIVSFEAFYLDGRKYAPDDYPLVRSLRNGETVTNEEIKLRRSDGSYVFISANSAPILNSQNRIAAAVVVIQDDTSRRRAEEALRNGAERLRLALAAAKLGDWSWDAATDLVTFSERAAQIFGIPSGPYMTWAQMQKLLHPADQERARLQVEQAVAESSDYDIEYRIIHPDGIVRWVAAKGRAQYDASGQVLGMLGVIQDITDRKQAEQALQQAHDQLAQRTIELEHVNEDLQSTLEELEVTEEELRQQNEELANTRRLTELERYRYQDLFNLAPNGYVVTDATGIVQEANQAIADLIAIDQNHLINTPFVIYVSEPDRGTFRNLLYELYQQIHPQKLQTDELHLKLSGKPPIPVAVTVTAIRDSQKQVVGARWLIQDITERKQVEAALRQSEERLRLALDAGHMGAWEWNLETNVQRWDVNQYKLFGMDKDKSELNADTFFKFIHPDDLLPAQELTAQVLEQRGSFQTEFRIICPDGNIRWLSSQGMVVQENNSRPVRLIGVNFDITERKQAEAERERLLASEKAARQEAESANRIKDEFLAVLSHELRSPLNPILGWAKLLQTRTFDQQAARRALETIERNAKLQTQLIDDLLDVSRILRGKLALNVAPVDLAATIEAALETVRLAAEAKNIQIHTRLNPISAAISGDMNRLQQVIWNLLSNAVKFTPTGGRVEVQLEQVGSYAQIQVRDTGRGISPTFLPYVFEYFRQEDGTTTRRFGGLGLGLAIVRYLTELHGGTVKAESPGEGQGATFTVRLPLLRNQTVGESGHEVESSSRVALPHLPLTGLRILVVDDEADMRELICTVLEQTGATLKVVASAAEALTAFNSFKPDILISDIGMPEINGYTLMRQLRSLQSGRLIPAIALTAYAGEYNQQQALAAGFQQHIAKPVEPEELVRSIAILVRQVQGATECRPL